MRSRYGFDRSGNYFGRILPAVFGLVLFGFCGLAMAAGMNCSSVVSGKRVSVPCSVSPVVKKCSTGLVSGGRCFDDARTGAVKSASRSRRGNQVSPL